jgi:hypothetical protein
MKAWKIIAVTAFAFIAAALITTSALAYHPSGQGINGSYGSNGAAQGLMGGMMGGSMRGSMRSGYSQYGNYTSHGGYPQQYGSWTGGCGMRNWCP